MNSKPRSKKKFFEPRENTFFLDFVRITGTIPALLWKRPRIYYAGDKKKSIVKGGVLIASNHITFTDPILLYCVFWRRRLRFFATKDLFTSRLVSFLFFAAGCIKIDKDNFSMGTLHDSVDKLKKGTAILIFPEGQINQKEQMLSFKSGAVLMSQLSGVPIQPVFLVRKEKWYHRSVAIVGEPIDVKSMCSRFPTMEEIQSITEHIKKCEQSLEEYYINNVLNKQKGKV